jgi:hypothetical protein
LTTGILDAAVLGNVLNRILKLGESDDLLSEYERTRRRALLEFPNPLSINNKERLPSTDPAKVGEREMFFNKLNTDDKFHVMVNRGMDKAMEETFEVPEALRVDSCLKWSRDPLCEGFCLIGPFLWCGFQFVGRRNFYSRIHHRQPLLKRYCLQLQSSPAFYDESEIPSGISEFIHVEQTLNLVNLINFIAKQSFLHVENVLTSRWSDWQ